MTSTKNLFAHQIESGEPSNGDYLEGKTFDEMVDLRLKQSAAFNTTREQMEEFVHSRIKEWKEHEGEHLLFFLREKENSTGEVGSVEILKVWESDVEALFDEHVLVEMAAPENAIPLHLPRLQLIQKKQPMCSLCNDEGLVEGQDSYGCTPGFETCQCK